MKNLTLLAALAACGMGVASAQTYVTDQPGIANTNGDTYYAFQLDDVTVQNLQDAGKTVFDYRIDNASRNLYIWENTMVAGDGSYPGVDMQTNGYIALEVGSAGWSGAGLCIGVDGDNTPGVDFRGLTDDTHVHLAVRADNAPASICFVILDGDTWATSEESASQSGFMSDGTPGRIAIGDDFNDNGAVYPSVGELNADGEWVAIDITLGDLKRLSPTRWAWAASIR